MNKINIESNSSNELYDLFKIDAPKEKNINKGAEKSFEDFLSPCKDPCHSDFLPINCAELKRKTNEEKSIQDDMKILMNNIANANKANYKKTYIYKDSKGENIKETSAASLIRSDRSLDLAIDGEGKGFLLENGEYTRDGRFKFNNKGLLVTESNEIPLKITYKDPKNKDWSSFELNINQKGEVIDYKTGNYLGKISADFSKKARIAQSYLETSNVHLPTELAQLSQMFRLLEAEKSIYYSSSKLDQDAISIARSAA